MPSRHSRGTRRASPPGPPGAAGARLRYPRTLAAAAGILMSALLLLLLEGGLRLGGFGHPAGFYIPSPGPAAWETNPRFGWRFFPPSLARSPVPGYLDEKPPGTLRIFLLGESAAQGVPNPEFGFGRLLRLMLARRHPGRAFEVVNTAMTAINSHAVREIARDCASLAPDAFLVYMGNNEIVGPYGPGTVFQGWSPSLPLIRANLGVKSTRTGQLLGRLPELLRPDRAPSRWQGMEMFLGNRVAADDPRLPKVYDNFRRNLEDIIRAGRGSGAAVIVSTVAVNLRDCAPFASEHGRDLPAAALARWEEAFRRGKGLEARGRPEEALEAYEAAARIDAQHAELQFRIARRRMESGETGKAREHFGRARDLDTLRFRADGAINEILRDAVASPEYSGVYGVDAELAFSEAGGPAGGVPGADLFYEHVHLNFEGNYLLARLFLDRLERALPGLGARGDSIPVPGPEECARLLALTPWDRAQASATMVGAMSRPPFTYQADNDSRVAALREEQRRLVERAKEPGAFEEARATYEAALEFSPEDPVLYRRFGRFLLDAGEPEAAIGHFTAALERYPGEPSLYADFGDAEQKRGRAEAAEARYRRALEMDPDLGRARSGLALSLATTGRIEEAIAEYRAVLQSDPGFTTARVNFAGLLARLGRLDEAIAEYRKAAEADPGGSLARYGLGMALANRGLIPEAIAAYREAARIDPSFSAAHVNLGNLLAGSGQPGEALAHFRRALEIDARDPLALYGAARALAALGRGAEAAASLRRALEIRPDFAEARRALQSLAGD